LFDSDIIPLSVYFLHFRYTASGVEAQQKGSRNKLMADR